MPLDDVRAALARRAARVPEPQSTAELTLERIGRRVRRRRTARALAIGVLTIAVAVVLAVTVYGSRRPDVVATATSTTRRFTSTTRPLLRSEPGPTRPAALAIGPNGHLYIADDARNQIVERLASGRFRVVAGSGVAGFSGDGHDATEAKLNYPSGMAFAPDGTLFFADQQNGRVRAVAPSGVISTVAGTGTLGWVTSGTPALRATIEPFDVKFGPAGDLYIVSEDEVLRLEPDSTLTRVAGVFRGAALAGIGGPAVDASIDGANALAFDSAGGFYLAGFDTKALLYVTRSGTMTLPYGHMPFYPRGNAGLATAPDGVVAMDSQSVVRVTDQREHTIASFARPDLFRQVHNFQPNGIAVANDGTIYVDTWNGNGYASGTAIAVIDAASHTPSLLWWHR